MDVCPNHVISMQEYSEKNSFAGLSEQTVNLLFIFR